VISWSQALGHTPKPWFCRECLAHSIKALNCLVWAKRRLQKTYPAAKWGDNQEKYGLKDAEESRADTM
jgi:hypothetical protein